MGKRSHSKYANKPVETCPSFRSGHLPADEDVLRLRTLTAPHVESFDYFLDKGLPAGIKDIEYAELELRDENTKLEDAATVQFWVENVNVAQPVKPVPSGRENSRRLLPRECRERRLLYAGTITGDFCYRFVERRNGTRFPGKTHKLNKTFGDLPIMVGSSRCHLRGMLPADLVKLKEEQNEFGGYFIVGGIERCIRMLQIPRRNYATAIQRSNYKNRGPTYSDLGVAIRCARYNGDQTSITNTVHYLTNGGANLRFSARKQEFFVPMVLLLRALSAPKVSSGADVAAGSSRIGITDEELYKRIVQGDNDNTFLVARVGLLLQDVRARYAQYNTPEECLAFLGTRFRRLSQKPDTTSDIEIGRYIVRKYVLIHLEDNGDKLELALFLLRKLYSFAAGDCGVDNADSLQNQELLLPGHLLSSFVKEKFEEFLQNLRVGLTNLLRKEHAETVGSMQNTKFWNGQVSRFSSSASGGIGKKVVYLLSTGNIVSTSGLDLMQVSGYTIVAERLNFLRYCAHFRSVHRGSFFMEMKTTAVRKLLPDQWGFLCPVHTPDGGPCGLLSHLSLKTIAISSPKDKNSEGADDLDDLLISLGVAPCGTGGHSGEGRAMSTYTFLPVLLDGRVVGGASPSSCKAIASHLRTLKVTEPPRVPPSLEVALVPPGTPGAPYPGLYLFTEAARLVRPVLQLATGKTELIGPLEQAFMDIACLEEDIREGLTTHIELDPTNMLSLIASLTPFSDQNQSPRNMYQCQMGKQTMGTPCHSLQYRPDNKLFKLKTPQAPIVQTSAHSKYKMDEYPNGTNAVVAVLSYTGFDMEDAMVLNKGSFNRGFGHASVYKSFVVDLQEESKSSASSERGTFRMGNKVKPGTDEFIHENLDADGLPKVSDPIKEGDKLYCVVNSLDNWDKTGRHKDREIAYVQDVRLIGDDSGKAMDNKACVTLRFPRNPVVGDKFSSRHGQKGVLSILWPQEDMPFSESGISPDVIINPHAFPSRMTIGMLVESMAGKSGALHGTFQDATPFTFHECGDKVSVDYFGEQLQAAGYNYYGSEALYSGLSGCVMHADLYIGIVYYQRLRHMVSDKYQVRATGPVNELTRQPIKGRRKGGGIRLGEMERDSLLSHGCAYLLQDRLLNCSDRHVAYLCSRCGDLLMPATERCSVQTAGQSVREATTQPKLRLFCRTPSCMKAVEHPDRNDRAVEPIVLPYVYRYLVNELAGMNIKIKLEIK